MNDERLSDVTQTNPLSLKDTPFLFLSFLLLLLLLIWRFLQTQTSLTQFGIEKTLYSHKCLFAFLTNISFFLSVFTKLLLLFLSVSVRLFSNAFISICFHKTIHYSDCFHMLSFSLFANKHLFINLSFSPY
jgi:hypothetical protein